MTFESASSRQPAIKDAEWLPNGDGIVFLGANTDSTLQIFRLDIPSGVLTRLSQNSRDPQRYSYRDDGIVYCIPVQSSKQIDDYPLGLAVQTAIGHMRAASYGAEVSTRCETYVAFGGAAVRKVDGENLSPQVAHAPGGRFAVALRRGQSADRFVLLNVEDGSVSGLVDSDVGPSTVNDQLGGEHRVPTVALWAKDAKRIILVNTLLPPAAQDRGYSTSVGYVVGYEMTTRSWDVIAPMIEVFDDGREARYVRAVALSASNSELTATYGRVSMGVRNAEKQERFEHTRRHGRWVSHPVDVEKTVGLRTAGNREVARTSIKGITVSVRESANDPLIIVASDGKHDVRITEIDTALQGIWRARVEPVQWREASGAVRYGGLMLPRNTQPGVLPPLVIQPYRYLPQHFLPDGYTSSGYAAQALVARGFAVLQIDIPAASDRSRLDQEGVLFVSRLDAAVDALAARGLVDPERVALIGFSRAGFNVLYAITHPGRTRFAAVVCVDSFTGGYSSYLAGAARSADLSAIAEYDAVPGGAFWLRKMQWLEHETTFNVDRVQAPTLFFRHGDDTLRGSSSLEVIGAFRANSKPLEYMYLPHGMHNLLRPRERLAEMEAVLEWMAFWLQGVEPPDSTRADRWKKLADLQREVMRITRTSQRQSSGSPVGSGGLHPSE